MKCFTINSSWLKEFNVWGVEFYTLLKKEEYEKILNLKDEDILKKVESLNLTNREVLKIELLAGHILRKVWRWKLNIFKDVNKPQYEINDFSFGVDKLIKEEEIKKKNEVYLNSLAKISKDKINLKQNYIILLSCLRHSLEAIKKHKIILNKKLKRNKELLLKIVMKGGLKE